MVKRQKPDFSGGEGCLVSPEFFSPALRSQLLLSLHKSPLSEPQKQQLINFSAEFAQSILGQAGIPGAEQVKQLRAVEANARRLAASIVLLSAPAREAVNGQADYLNLAAIPPVELPESVRPCLSAGHGSLLSNTWDWVEALRVAAEYTHGQYRLNRQAKPTQDIARQYIASVANCVFSLTGKLPPKDKSAWFAGFLACLKPYFEVGPRLIETAIHGLKESQR